MCAFITRTLAIHE
jgi:signal transduction histidine kinase